MSAPADPTAQLPDEAMGTPRAQVPIGHVVLANADSDSYRSLRRRPMSRAERFKLGRSLRQQVPRSSMGDWKAPANRPDPVEQIKQSHEGRLDWLDPDPGRSHGGITVWFSARNRRRDGRGCRSSARNRHHPGHLR